MEARNIHQVRVSKAQLKLILKENRDNHRQLFEEAMEAYKQEAIRQLENHIERIKANSPVQVQVSLPLPEDHTDDYDTVMSMLDMSLDDEIILDDHDYAQYVLDDWGWKERFAASYSHYTGNKL